MRCFGFGWDLVSAVAPRFVGSSATDFITDLADLTDLRDGF